MEEEEDGEIQRTPSDHYQNDNSNSSLPDTKSDASRDADEHSMPPPKVKSPEKTPDPDINLVMNFIKDVPPQPISSISDSDDNVDCVVSGGERPKKKIPRKRPRPEIDGGNSSSDEGSRYSRRSSIDEKKPRGRPKHASATSSDTNSVNGTKKQHKSPRKEPQSRKNAVNRRIKSHETIPSSDGSSDEESSRKPAKPAPPVPVKAKEPVKKPPKKKTKSPKKIPTPVASSSSDSEEEQRTKHPSYPVRHSSSSSAHSESDNSCGKTDAKIKIVSDKKKNDMVRRLFNIKVSEGGKGGKGGGKGKGGQVVVITPEDTQNQSKSNEASAQNAKYLSPSSAFNTAKPSVVVSIDLSRIDLSRLNLPVEKLKNAVVRTKSPAVPVVEEKRNSKKRRRSSNHDDQDRWRHHSGSKAFDQLSVSSSSSSTSSSSSGSLIDTLPIENPAQRITSYTTNYTNDQLNNNVEPKAKDMNSFYHSPSSVDTKLPKIKRETDAYAKRRMTSKPIKNDFANKIKQEMKQEDFDGTLMRPRATSMTTNSNNSYKDKKRKPPDGTSDNSLPLPPTNHERLTQSSLTNGDLLNTKQEVIKKIYVSYFERTSDEIEQAEAR